MDVFAGLYPVTIIAYCDFNDIERYNISMAKKKAKKKIKAKPVKKAKSLETLSMVDRRHSAPKLRFSKSVARQIAATMNKSMNDDDIEIRL